MMLTGRQVILWVLLGCAAIWLSACGYQSAPSYNSTAGYTVDSLFREFYAQFGGAEVVGDALSDVIPQGALRCQYTEKVLMCYDPNAAGNDRFSLFPIGNTLNLTDGKYGVPPFSIYPGFQEMIDRLHGEPFVGKPISAVVYNYKANRIEQYFENVAMYRLLDDPQAKTTLLSYGRFVCGTVCAFPPQRTNAAIIVDYPAPFMQSFESLGGTQVFGAAVSLPYQATDGNMEVIFEKAAFYTTPEQPQVLRIRPLGQLLNILMGDPVPRSQDPSRARFIATQPDGLGYHVPIPFDDFIAHHGGYNTFGNPLSEPVLLADDETIQQCYTNLCLQYAMNAPEGERLCLADLGLIYAERNTLDPVKRIGSDENAPREIQLEISEAASQITSTQTQVIQIWTFNRADSTPVSGISGQMTVLYRDGTSEPFAIPPTDETGYSQVKIPPVPQLENGSIVAYRVCLNLPNGALCRSESYHIWNVP